AGKSTLLNAICGILFGFRDLNTVRKYEPWEEHDRYAGDLEMTLDDGRRLRVERDFRTAQARVVELLPDGERTLFSGSADPRGAKAEDALYFDVIGEALGFRDEAVFRNTAFVGQSGLKAEVSEQIRRLLSGAGDVDYKGALHELHSRYSELTADNPWRAGRTGGRRRALEEARERHAESEAELAAAELRLRKTAALEDEMLAAEARREAEADELAARRAAATALETACSVLDRRAAAAAKREEADRRLAQCRGLRERAARADQEIDRAYAPHRKAPPDLLEILAAHGAETAERDREQQEMEETRARLDGLRPTLNTRLGAGLGGGLAVSAVAAGVATPIGAVVGLLGAGALGLLGFTLGRRLGTGYKAQRRDLQDRIEALGRALRARGQRIDELERRAGPILVGRDPESAAEEHRAYLALLEEARKATAAARGAGDLSVAEEAAREAAREEGRVEAAWIELRARHPWIDENAGRSRLGSELELARRRASEAEAALEKTRARFEEARVEHARWESRPEGDVARLKDAAARGAARVRDLSLEKDALKEAIDVLDACIQEFQENDVFRLAEDMSKTFAKLTGDRYVRVHLGPSLEPTVATADRMGISPEDLSQGAHDQLYFAMRMAVIRHLARREAPPVFLDDPFVNFDAERAAAARDILSGMSDHQSVMVTCDRQYTSWTDAVIDLDRAKTAAA
ncbi:MAG TPA: hypothetical protein VEI02_02845, partial [Planctomycetota bacterium]|nr:hypothetical protein [Planctomycetota bacterium]